MPKVYEESSARLNRTMGKVDDISEAVGMVLKCAVAHARGVGRWYEEDPSDSSQELAYAKSTRVKPTDIWESTSS